MAVRELRVLRLLGSVRALSDSKVEREAVERAHTAAVTGALPALDAAVTRAALGVSKAKALRDTLTAGACTRTLFYST